MADEKPNPMTSFVWWLHGWSEINGGVPPTPAQWQVINDRLDSVFNKVTPDRKVTVAPVTGALNLSYPVFPNLGPGVICATRTDLPAPAISIESGNNRTYYLTGISGLLLSNAFLNAC